MERFKSDLTGVPTRSVSAVMAKGDSLGEVGVQTEPTSDGDCHLRYL